MPVLAFLLPFLPPLQDNARAQQPMILTTGENYPPFIGPGLPRGGMIADIITRIFQDMGLDPAYRHLPWKRAMLQAEEGAAAGTFPWELQPELKTRFHCSDPIVHMDLFTYVDAKTGPILAASADLENKRFCLPLGHKPHGMLRRMVAEGRVHVERPGLMKNCFEMLRLGRVDFVSVSAMTAQQHARLAYGYADGVRREPVAGISVGLHLLLGRSQPGGAEMMASFNRTLAAFRKDGRLVEIIQPHLWVP